MTVELPEEREEQYKDNLMAIILEERKKVFLKQQKNSRKKVKENSARGEATTGEFPMPVLSKIRNTTRSWSTILGNVKNENSLAMTKSHD